MNEKLMRALVLKEKYKLELSHISIPEKQQDHELVKVEVCGLGGSECLAYQNPGVRPLPHVMGHSIAGLTVDNRKVAVYPLLSCGDCEFCDSHQENLCKDWSLIGVHSNGGLSEYVNIPSNKLIDIPDDISWKQLAFLEPFANALHAWNLSGANEDKKIAIIGAGGIGLGLTVCAKQAGCSIIAIDESSVIRQNVANNCGATHTLSQAEEPFDIVFDTVGSEASRDKAIELTKKGGSIIFMGFYSNLYTVNVPAIIRDQKKLCGSFAFNVKEFIKAIDLIRFCDAEWVKSICLEEVEVHLQTFANGIFDVVKLAAFPGVNSPSK
jgi:2-desacetyl-2-hydroxyethyl bacteriochlorophyllide A dehydrogenase